MYDDEEEGEISTPRSTTNAKASPVESNTISNSNSNSNNGNLKHPHQHQHPNVHNSRQTQFPLAQQASQSLTSQTMRNSGGASSNNDFRGSGPRFGGGRGGGPPNSRPFGPGGRRHNSFSSLPPLGGANTNAGGGSNQSTGGNNSTNGPLSRDFRGGPPQHDGPPRDFGDRDRNFRDRDFRGAPDFRGDFRHPSGPGDKHHGGHGPPHAHAPFKKSSSLPLPRDRNDGRANFRPGGPAPRDGPGMGHRDPPFGPSSGNPIIRDGGGSGAGDASAAAFGQRGFRDGPPFGGPPPGSLERSRSGSMSGSRDVGSGGAGPRPSFGPRSSVHHSRDGGLLPSMSSRGREGSFSDMAGPPRDRPFRDEGGHKPPMHRGAGQGPAGSHSSGFGGLSNGNPIGGNLPMDPRRPTDPRRRGSGHESGPPPAHHANDGPTGAPDIQHSQHGTNHQNRGRIGSYSSLADSSGPQKGHDGPPSFRSPSSRRTHVDVAGRDSDRRDRFGPPGGMVPSQRQSWSPAPERRHPGGSPRSMSLGSNSSVALNTFNSKHGSSGPPTAPSLSSRGVGPPSSNHFRDPRAGTMERSTSGGQSGDIRPDVKSSLSGPTPRMDDFTIKKRGFLQSHVQPASSSAPVQGGPSDAFGRTRDHGNDRPPFGENPRFSPSKQPSSGLHERNPSFSGSLGNPIGRSVSLGTRPEPAKLAAPSLPPLRTSALGEDNIVERAETAVLHLSEVIGKPELKASSTRDELSLLPAKQLIMSAVTEIEKMVKEAQKDFEACQKEKTEALKEEEIEQELESKRIEEEKIQKLAEQQRREEEKTRLLHDRKTKELQVTVSNNQVQIDAARSTIEQELEIQIASQLKGESTRLVAQLEDQVAVAKTSFASEIADLKTSIEKTRSSIQRLETRASTAEDEYQALVRSGEAEVGKEKEETTKKRGSELMLPSLVDEISSQNRRKASEAQVFGLSMVSESDQYVGDEHVQEASNLPKDPKFGKTFEEWSVLTKQVSNTAEALYSEPSESPYFRHNEEVDALLRPSVKEYIRDKNTRLTEEWTALAEEYEVRKRLYEKQQRKLAKKALRGSISVSKKSIFAGGKESKEAAQGIDRSNILESGGRSSNNPYRRARRGNEVRSEYEQEQIIAEIAAKEAMEKRIAHGGCKVARQVSRLERELTASFVNTFTAKKIDDPLEEARGSEMTNMWTDMEKCIYLDRFLQFPKDFRRIASFLKNKTTKDCVAFYYDSKQTVPYKGALKEHVMRRKRKGDYQIWDASIQAAVSVGAEVLAGSSEEKPVEFRLPSSDRSFRTYMLHPLRQRALQDIVADGNLVLDSEDELRPEDSKWKSKKRARDPLFSLDKEQTKYLRLASQESMAPPSTKSPTVDEAKKGKDLGSEDRRESGPTTPVRKPPQKWTAAEKKIFVETLEQHGRDWVKLAQAVGTKNEKQIKNFYYDWKKGKSRTPTDKKGGRKEKGGKASDTSRKSTEAKRDDPQETQGGKRETSRRDNGATIGEDEAMQAEQLEKTYESSTDSRTTEQNGGRETPSGIPSASASESAENPSTNVIDFANAGNRDLIQQLLSQQLQQQQLNQQIHIGQQQPQSAIQQLLSQQHIQREQQQQNQLNQLSLDEARRLLEHQQSQRGSVISNLLSSPWLATNQLLQAQAGLPSHAAIAAALRGDSGGVGGGMNDIGDIQRYLQLQQASQGLGLSNHGAHLNSLLLGGSGGLGSNPNNGLGSALLSQLESLAGANTNAATEASAADHLSLANAQALLGFTSTGNAAAGTLTNALFRQGSGGGSNIEPTGVSDALALLARSMQRGDGSSHGFGRPDGNDRFN